MDKKARVQKVIDLLKSNYPEARIALEFKTPFQLLIATILAAQCTDERVNQVTKTLFRKYKTPVDFISVGREELEKEIFSTGFYRQKAKSIQECCKAIIEKYDGKLPKEFDELTKLPGVGRKTASVIVGNAYGEPAIAVDTHVKRISNILGFVEEENADKIELLLKDIVPTEDWTIYSHLIASDGRNICIARRPKCQECFISKFCPYPEKPNG